MRRRPAREIAVWTLSLLLAFVRHHGLFDSYPVRPRPLHVDQFPTILAALARQASYGAFYLPWIGALVPFGFARNWRRAALPLLVAAGSVAAERVLFTTLASLTIAAASASGD
jgi:hypothetical protein